MVGLVQLPQGSEQGRLQGPARGWVRAGTAVRGGVSARPLFGGGTGNLSLQRRLTFRTGTGSGHVSLQAKHAGGI